MFNLKTCNIKADQLLGLGSLGKVYAYKEGEENDKWVVKEIRIKSARQLNLSVQEIVLGFNQNHASINPVTGFNIQWTEEAFKVYIKMPRMKQSLADVIKYHKQNQTYLSRQEIIQHFSSLVSALMHLKAQNICHRDIKPSNILLDEKNMVKLSDVGSAKYTMYGYQDESASVIGTQGYMAPEIFEPMSHKKKNWIKADIWSLGVTIAELCLIKPKRIMFDSLPEEVSEIVNDNLLDIEKLYGKRLSDVLSQMLREDPESRIDYENLAYSLQEYNFENNSLIETIQTDTKALNKSHKTHKLEKEVNEMNNVLEKELGVLNSFHKEEGHEKVTAVNLDVSQANFQLQEQEKYQEAANKNKQARIIHPDSELTYDNWGNPLQKRKISGKEVEKHEKAAIIDPNDSPASHGCEDTFQDQRKHQEITEKYERSLMDINDSQGHLNLGQKKHKMFRSTSSDHFDSFDISLNLEENSGSNLDFLEIIGNLQSRNCNLSYLETLIGWGDTLQNQGKYQEAAEKYEQAIRINPYSKFAYYNWENALQKQGKSEEAVESYESFTIFDSNYKEAYYAWGNALMKQGKYKEAGEKYERVTTIDPNHKEAYYAWGDALQEERKYLEAAEKYERVTIIDPNHKEAYYAWGGVLRKQEKYEETGEKYERAAEKYKIAIQTNSHEKEEFSKQGNDQKHQEDENVEQKTHVRRKSIHKNEQDEDRYEQSGLQANMRVLFDQSFQGDLIEAYNKLQSYDRLWEKLTCYEQETRFLISVDVGTVYLYAQMDEKAKPWLEEAEEFSPSQGRDANVTYYLIRMYNMLGDLSTRNNKEGLALYYLTKARHLIDKDSPDFGRSLSWNDHNMAEVYLLDKNDIQEDEKVIRLGKAKELMLSALKVREELKRPRLLAYSYEALARLEIKATNFVKAEKNCELAMLALNDLKTRRKKDGYKAISEFFLRGKCLCSLGQIWYQTKAKEEDKEEGRRKYNKGIRILDSTLPRGNALSEKYRKEYEKIFNKPLPQHVDKKDDKVLKSFHESQMD